MILVAPTAYKVFWWIYTQCVGFPFRQQWLDMLYIWCLLTFVNTYKAIVCMSVWCPPSSASLTCALLASIIACSSMSLPGDPSSDTLGIVICNGRRNYATLHYTTLRYFISYHLSYFYLISIIIPCHTRILYIHICYAFLLCFLDSACFIYYYNLYNCMYFTIDCNLFTLMHRFYFLRWFYYCIWKKNWL